MMACGDIANGPPGRPAIVPPLPESGGVAFDSKCGGRCGACPGWCDGWCARPVELVEADVRVEAEEDVGGMRLGKCDAGGGGGCCEWCG